MMQEKGSDWVDSHNSKVEHFTEQTLWKSFQQICTEIPINRECVYHAYKDINFIKSL